MSAEEKTRDEIMGKETKERAKKRREWSREEITRREIRSEGKRKREEGSQGK